MFRQARRAIPAALRFLGVADSVDAAATLEQGLGTGQCLYRDVRDRVGLIQVLPAGAAPRSSRHSTPRPPTWPRRPAGPGRRGGRAGRRRTTTRPSTTRTGAYAVGEGPTPRPLMERAHLPEVAFDELDAYAGVPDEEAEAERFEEVESPAPPGLELVPGLAPDPMEAFDVGQPAGPSDPDAAVRAARRRVRRRRRTPVADAMVEGGDR